MRLNVWKVLILAVFFLIVYLSIRTLSWDLEKEFTVARIVNYNESKNVFFVETGESSRRVTLSARQACAIESAALTNPHMRISLLYISQKRFLNLRETPAVAAI